MDATASPGAPAGHTTPDDRAGGTDDPVGTRAPDRRNPVAAAPAVAAAAALTLGVTQILHTQTVPFASVGDYVCEGAYALYLTAAVAAFRSALVPRAVAVALPATLPLTMALGQAGPLVEALTWAVLGWSMARAARRRAR